MEQQKKVCCVSVSSRWGSVKGDEWRRESEDECEGRQHRQCYLPLALEWSALGRCDLTDLISSLAGMWSFFKLWPSGARKFVLPILSDCTGELSGTAPGSTNNSMKDIPELLSEYSHFQAIAEWLKQTQGPPRILSSKVLRCRVMRDCTSLSEGVTLNLELRSGMNKRTFYKYKTNFSRFVSNELSTVAALRTIGGSVWFS